MDACFEAPVSFDVTKKICDTIIDVVGEDACAAGCRAFYTPEEWMARGERYGLNSILIVVHDGGDLAPYFNYDYGRYELTEKMRKALKKIGYWSEACTSWYTAIYSC
jgi:hypothetical protein